MQTDQKQHQNRNMNQKNDNFFDEQTDYLHYELVTDKEPKALWLPNEQPEPTRLLGPILFIWHYSKASQHANLYQEHNLTYLHFIFHRYLVQNQQQLIAPASSALLAQFVPYNSSKAEIESYATYVVAYKIQSEDQKPAKNNIEISFARVTPNSFLRNILHTSTSNDPSDWDQRLRRCLLVTTSPVRDAKLEEKILLKAYLMPITPEQTEEANTEHSSSVPLNKRLFLICKHGWLGVICSNRAHEDQNSTNTTCYLLLEDEYLLFSEGLKEQIIFYQRLIQMNLSQTEKYLGSTSIEQEANSCEGMIISAAVLLLFQLTPNKHNIELISGGAHANAIVNWSYLQQLLTV